MALSLALALADLGSQLGPLGVVLVAELWAGVSPALARVSGETQI